jgi:nucleotide-binding universal stress UspA family protein
LRAPAAPCVLQTAWNASVRLAGLLNRRPQMNTSFDSNRPIDGARIPGGHGIRRILASLDFSRHSEECLNQAIFMAEACESDLTLLHVMQPHEQPGTQPTDTLAWEIARQQASANLERLEKTARRSGRPVEVLLEQGRAAERITAIAHERRADLVVLGSHGEGGAPMVSLGTTAQHVLALAQGSVFIARANRTTPQGPFCPKRILLPLDGSARTESTLPTVARIAKRSGAEVLLAHVVPDPLPTEVLGAPEDLDLARELASRLELRAKKYLSRIQDQLTHDVARARSVVVRNADQPQSLLALAQAEGVDLVVLCAHGATCNRERSFGSVSTYLLAHAPIPLIVLQDLAEADLHVGGPSSEIDRAPRPPSMQARGSA